MRRAYWQGGLTHNMCGGAEADDLMCQGALTAKLYCCATEASLGPISMLPPPAIWAKCTSALTIGNASGGAGGAGQEGRGEEMRTA